MRVVTLCVLLISWSAGAEAFMQSQAAAQERRASDSSSQGAPEEVVVRGRRLATLRFEVQEARERAYDIFNEINSNDDFDVRCRDERRYFSKTNKRVCRAQFESRIAAEAGAEYMDTLRIECPPTAASPRAIQECIFGGYGQ